MGRSLGRAAYRALSRRSSRPTPIVYADRPEGELVWAHANDETRIAALGTIGQRLKQQRRGLTMLVTYATGLHPEGFAAPEGVDLIVRLPDDLPTNADAFLAHWRPSACLWTGGELMPHHIDSAAEAGVPLFLADVGGADVTARPNRWMPDFRRSTLELFERIATPSNDAARHLRRMGIPPERISLTPRLRPSATPPPCSDDELADTMRDIGGRPVWLAAHVTEREFDAVLTAHRSALKLSHRLLLIIVTAQVGGAAALKEALAGYDLRAGYWDDGDTIDDYIQVYVADGPDDIGLWYRVAPLTFMASSLGPDGLSQSPLNAAALGSAILYGPNVDAHRDSYARLAAARAARTVNGADSLGTAVVQLIAPDLAAAMALAGWEVATDGAELVDLLVDLLQDALDARA